MKHEFTSPQIASYSGRLLKRLAKFPDNAPIRLRGLSLVEGEKGFVVFDISGGTVGQLQSALASCLTQTKDRPKKARKL